MYAIIMFACDQKDKVKEVIKYYCTVEVKQYISYSTSSSWLDELITSGSPPSSCSKRWVSQAPPFSPFLRLQGAPFWPHSHPPSWAVWQLFLALNDDKRTLCNPREYKVDIGAILSRHLIEGNLLALCIIKSSLLGDNPFFLHVDLIADNHGDNVSLVVVLCIVGNRYWSIWASCPGYQNFSHWSHHRQ